LEERGKVGSVLNIDFSGGTAYGGQLTRPMSITELRERFDKADSSKLPGLSIEQIFLNSPEYTQGDKSKLFTIRTTNRTAEDVQAAVSELLGDDLKRTLLENYKVNPDNAKQVTLTFAEPVVAAEAGEKAEAEAGKTRTQPAFASRAQVSLILQRVLAREGFQSESQTFTLIGEGPEREGRFQTMKLELNQPLPAGKLEQVLKMAQADFAAKPQPERLEKFDAQLASDTQTRALYAIFASWGAIMLYLWVRFGNWTFGTAAVLCLMHDLFFTMGIIAACYYLHANVPWLATPLLIQDFKLDLPAVASLLTLIGFSVNDTIVVFDRIREVRGKNPALTPEMINDSINQTLSRTILTSLTAFLVVLVLYIFGGEGVHLFAFVMVVGVIIGTLSSIFVASPLLLLLGEGSRPTSVREAKAARSER
jgi:SecD/SecF fusion protein